MLTRKIRVDKVSIKGRKNEDLITSGPPAARKGVKTNEGHKKKVRKGEDTLVVIDYSSSADHPQASSFRHARPAVAKKDHRRRGREKEEGKRGGYDEKRATGRFIAFRAATN